MPLRIVLVRTHNPGQHRGGGARREEFRGGDFSCSDRAPTLLHPDAIAFASGAEDLLRKVKILPAWSDLLDGAETLVAMSAMRGPRLARAAARDHLQRNLLVSSRRQARHPRLRAGARRADDGGAAGAATRASASRPQTPSRPSISRSPSRSRWLFSPLFHPSKHRGEAAERRYPTSSRRPRRDVRRLLLSFKEVLSSAGYPGRGHLERGHRARSSRSCAAASPPRARSRCSSARSRPCAGARRREPVRSLACDLERAGRAALRLLDDALGGGAVEDHPRPLAHVEDVVEAAHADAGVRADAGIERHREAAALE